MRKIMQTLSILSVLVVMGTGCTSFPRHRLPEIGQLAPPADPSKLVEASYTCTSGAEIYKGQRQEFQPQAKQQIEQVFIDTLKEAGYFTAVRPGQGGGIQLDADLLNYGSRGAATAAGIIGGLSLTAIPCWATDNYKLKVIVTTSQGIKKEYILDDAATTVIWLPLIVATPFRDTEKVAPDVWKNMYKTLILKMQKDGILPAARKEIQTSYLINVEFVLFA